MNYQLEILTISYELPNNGVPSSGNDGTWDNVLKSTVFKAFLNLNPAYFMTIKPYFKHI